MLGGARSQRTSRAGMRHSHHAHPYHHHRQLFPVTSPLMSPFAGHLSPFGMSPFAGFGFGNAGLLCFGGGGGHGLGLGSGSIFSGLENGGFSSVQSFSSGNGGFTSPAMRSVATSTKFVNGKKITTKKYFLNLFCHGQSINNLNSVFQCFSVI